jgi:hypothetical protein
MPKGARGIAATHAEFSVSPNPSARLHGFDVMTTKRSFFAAIGSPVRSLRDIGLPNGDHARTVATLREKRYWRSSEIRSAAPRFTPGGASSEETR